jgi:hypothetical protein
MAQVKQQLALVIRWPPVRQLRLSRLTGYLSRDAID